VTDRRWQERLETRSLEGGKRRAGDNEKEKRRAMPGGKHVWGNRPNPKEEIIIILKGGGGESEYIWGARKRYITGGVQKGKGLGITR